MSVFHGAANITIYGGNISAVSNVNTLSSDDVIGILASRSAEAGLLDAAERFDAPKCSNGTRVSMIVGMKRFVQQDGPPSIFWLYGPAGVGKSAVAQSLALSLKDEGDHAASFFFSRTAPRRSNGNQLIVTLACQLAINIPAIRPFLTKVVKENPFIFNATNAVKMQSFIVDPINQLHQMSLQDPQILAQNIVNGKPHPRLILVDGLDECNDPQIQRDLLLCIGNAVSRVSLPFRFVIASRPEPHVLDTFEYDPVFSGPHGVRVFRKNLGDDEDVEAQIATFLLNEFAEIRRSHPIRNYLPQPWPLPSQIEQLVLKSSKGFIYAATVIRYIKMPKNRPDECLDRIFGLSEIPTRDNPFEPLDILYRHIFESVPDDNKESVRRIFHFLVVPDTERWHVTPPIIERHFNFRPGHVEHVLRDLLCLVALKPFKHPYCKRNSSDNSYSFEEGTTIAVLHASLPDFLLNRLRSGPFSIDIGDAHAAVAASLFDSMSEIRDTGNRFRSPESFSLENHLISAHMTDILYRAVNEFDVVAHYRQIIDTYDTLSGLSTVDGLIRYIQVLASKQIPTSQIMALIRSLESDVIQRCPMASTLYPLDDKMVQCVMSRIRFFVPIHTKKLEFFESKLGNNIFKLRVLLLMQLLERSLGYGFDLSINGNNNNTQLISTPSQKDAHVVCKLLKYVIHKSTASDPPDEQLRMLAIQISGNHLSQMAYSPDLISVFEGILDLMRGTMQYLGWDREEEQGFPDTHWRNCMTIRSWFHEIAPFIIGYLERIQSGQAAVPQIKGRAVHDLEAGTRGNLRFDPDLWIHGIRMRAWFEEDYTALKFEDTTNLISRYQEQYNIGKAWADSERQRPAPLLSETSQRSSGSQNNDQTMTIG